ncbi:hypothetical protein ACJX0J_010810, partial [Zea mays]
LSFLYIYIENSIISPYFFPPFHISGMDLQQVQSSGISFLAFFLPVKILRILGQRMATSWKFVSFADIARKPALSGANYDFVGFLRMGKKILNDWKEMLLLAKSFANFICTPFVVIFWMLPMYKHKIVALDGAQVAQLLVYDSLVNGMNTCDVWIICCLILLWSFWNLSFMDIIFYGLLDLPVYGIFLLWISIGICYAYS